MGAPSVLWNEADALDQLGAFVVACCGSDVPAGNVYRAQPSAAPGVFGRSVLLLPLTPVPEYASPFGAESDSPQQQRWSVAVTAAAAGAWSVTLLGQTTAPFVAGPGDSAVVVAAGLRAAVDALGLPVTTEPLASPPAAFGVLGDAAGQSLGVSAQAPPGGAAALAVVDDCIRRAVYNWGVWRVRVMFRDVLSAQQHPAGAPPRSMSPVLAERFRLWLQATSLPATNGLAYPYRRDQLLAAPARLSWLQTEGPFDMSTVEANTWVRVVALDVSFQVPVALTHDVPSLDAMGLAGPAVIGP